MNSSQLMCSVVDSPASQSVSPESEKAGTMNGGSGQNSPVSFAAFDPLTSSWKTYQACLPWMEGDSLESSLVTWPRAGTMRNGKCFRRQLLARGTDANDSSLLPTPIASDWRSGKSSKKTLDRNSRPLREIVTANALPSPTTGETTGHLSPLFVEWMMGFPPEWTALEGSDLKR